MRIAIFSDVHGNLEALEAGLADMEQRGCEQYYCLGDVVGYGANPSACIENLRSRGISTVQGNHDEAVACDVPLVFFNEVAAKALSWTRRHVSAPDREWLRSLPRSRQESGILLAHTINAEDGYWDYVDDASCAAPVLKHQETTLSFIGHTHVPTIYHWSKGRIAGERSATIRIVTDSRYLVDVGSLGQPRDRNPAGSYALYDTEEACVEIVRVSYDAERTKAQIIQAGLPKILGERLVSGF